MIRRVLVQYPDTDRPLSGKEMKSGPWTGPMCPPVHFVVGLLNPLCMGYEKTGRPVDTLTRLFYSVQCVSTVQDTGGSVTTHQDDWTYGIMRLEKAFEAR